MGAFVKQQKEALINKKSDNCRFLIAHNGLV